MPIVNFSGYKCKVEVNTYVKGGMAIRLIDLEDLCPVTTATVFIEGLKLAEDEVVIKNYHQNEGILEALLESGIIKEVIGKANIGYETVPICKVDLNILYNE